MLHKLCAHLMYVTAIVLAAGKGLRLNSKISKPLIEIDFQPAIIYCLNTLSKHPFIKDIILVANPKNRRDILNKIRQYRISKVKDVILGGRLRQDSVLNGLNAIDNRTELVLIHDAVRPFISKEIVSSVIKAAKIYGAAITGVPVKATIKQVTSPCRRQVRLRRKKLQVTSHRIVEKTLNRENLWEIQTPQVFRKELLLKAYKKFGNTEVTDDSSLVERLSHKISVVMGSYFNIKITTPEDLILAEAIYKIQKSKCKNKNF